jgi:hypothetical protein
MAKDFTTRSAEEAKTHEMLDVDNMDAKGIEWSQHRQIVAMVFRACWHASLSVDRLTAPGRSWRTSSTLPTSARCSSS